MFIKTSNRKRFTLPIVAGVCMVMFLKIVLLMTFCSPRRKSSERDDE